MAGGTYREKIFKRQESNRLIVQQIAEMVEKYPDSRFQQILANMNITETQMVGEVPNEKIFCKDKFHEESVDTLSKLKTF